MTIEVAKTISVDARNTLVRTRDAIQSRHGITIYFPKNRVRGAYQDMILKGGPNAIARAEHEIDTILLAWRDEFAAYKQRQKYRKELRRLQNTKSTPDFPSVIDDVAPKRDTRRPKNAFSALDGLEHEDPDTNHHPVPVAKHTHPTLTGWAAMAAKPPVNNTPKKPTASTGSGAMFTYTDHFDWAEDEP